MKKKFNVLICLELITTLLLCGCGGTGTPAAEVEKKFTIDDYNMSITATEKWEEVTEGSWDIQLQYENDASINVMGYYMEELPEGYTKDLTYEWQNDDIFSEKEDVFIRESAYEIETSDKIITVTSYTADTNGFQHLYDSCLVEFKEHEDVFAWVLVIAKVPYMSENEEALLDMVKTLEYKEGE